MTANKSTYSKWNKAMTFTGVAAGSIGAAAAVGEIANHDATSLLSLNDILATAGISVATYFALETLAEKYFEDRIKELEKWYAQKEKSDPDNHTKYKEEYKAEMKSIKREKMMLKMLIRSSIPVGMVTAAAWEGKDWNEYLEREIPGTNLEYGELFILSIAAFILGKLIEAIQNKMTEKQQLVETGQLSEEQQFAASKQGNASKEPDEGDIAGDSAKVVSNSQSLGSP
jgi:hypothetical protein